MLPAGVSLDSKPLNGEKGRKMKQQTVDQDSASEINPAIGPLLKSYRPMVSGLAGSAIYGRAFFRGPWISCTK